MNKAEFQQRQSIRKYKTEITELKKKMTELKIAIEDYSSRLDVLCKLHNNHKTKTYSRSTKDKETGI